MLPNDLVTGLDAVRITRIMQLMQQLEAELDFVIKLDPEDRQSVNAVDQGRQPFVDLTRDYTAKYTALLEISNDMRDKIARNNFDFNALREMLTKLESLTEGVNDTAPSPWRHLLRRGPDRQNPYRSSDAPQEARC